jgi:hypothetical protein
MRSVASSTLGAGTPRQNWTCSSDFLRLSVMCGWRGRVLPGERVVGGGGEGAELLGDLLDEVVVVQIAGGGEDHVAGREAAGVEVEDGLLVEAGDGLDRAEDGAAEGVVLPEVLGEELVDEVVGIVLVHLDLFEDDALLAGEDLLA